MNKLVFILNALLKQLQVDSSLYNQLLSNRGQEEFFLGSSKKMSYRSASRVTTVICFTLSLSFSFMDQALSQTCDCNEYIYLNEVNAGGRIYKFRLDGPTSYTDVGNPWFQNASGSGGVIDPHGLAADTTAEC